MPHIKFVNEEKRISYDTEESINRLIYYIFNIKKTGFDSVRPGLNLEDLVGCYPFIGDKEQSKYPGEVSNLMVINNKCYRKPIGNLMKHRIISFHVLDYVLPIDAYRLAEHVARAYGENYITAYGVHMDTNYIHIHLAIDTISWRDGKSFSISYEKRWIWGMVNSWLAAHNKYIDNNICAQTKYEKYVGLY